MKTEKVMAIDGYKFAIHNRYDEPIVKNSVKFPEGAEFVSSASVHDLIKTCTCFIDIGAHIGCCSVAVAQKLRIPVHSYEVNPDNYCLLERNIKLNKVSDFVNTYNYAITGTDVAELIFYRHAKYSASGTCARKLRGSGDGELIPALNINSILADFEEPLLVKIDTEGMEFDIVMQMEFGNIRVLFVEYHFMYNKDMMKFYHFMQKLDQNFEYLTTSSESSGHKGNVLAFITAYNSLD